MRAASHKLQNARAILGQSRKLAEDRAGICKHRRHECFLAYRQRRTAIKLLMREIGIAGQSLYDTFGDKCGFCLRALAYYRDQTNGAMKHMLTTTRSAKDGCAKLLYDLAGETRERPERGCLLLSANLRRDPGDAVVAEFLRDKHARVAAIFAKALRRAQKQGFVASECPRRSCPLLCDHNPSCEGHGQTQGRSEISRTGCASGPWHVEVKLANLRGVVLGC
jgi:hypothetical protein